VLEHDFSQMADRVLQWVKHAHLKLMDWVRCLQGSLQRLEKNCFTTFLAWVLGLDGKLHQGRTEVKWRPGQEKSLASPCSKLSYFENNVP